MNAPTLALAVHHPWAWLIIRPDLGGADRLAAIAAGDLKTEENRTCPLDKFPGAPRPLHLPFRIYIHATLSFDESAPAWVAERFSHIQLPRRYDFGGLIGTVDVTGCVTRSQSPWFMGPVAFTLANAEAIPFRRLRGQQGFFRVESNDPKQGTLL